MDDVKEWADDIVDALKSYAAGIITCLIETTFLSLWIAMQWVMNSKIIPFLKLNGMDNIILNLLQILFAISTLAPIIFTIYRDLRIRWIKTQRTIRYENQIGDDNEKI